MGLDSSTACVDSNFQVFGIQGLRVVDLSVCPFVPNAHTQTFGEFVPHKKHHLKTFRLQAIFWGILLEKNFTVVLEGFYIWSYSPVTLVLITNDIVAYVIGEIAAQKVIEEYNLDSASFENTIFKSRI